VYDVENPDKRRVIPHKINANKETRSYEPQDENQEPEETEAYGNQEYDEPRSLEDDVQQEHPYQNKYSADDAEDLSGSQRYAGGESYSIEERQEDYPRTGEVEQGDHPETGEVEQDGQTESYGTDAGREFAYSRQNADDQEPRFGQAFDDNCDDYNETQRYSANLRNAAEQPAPYVEPVSEFRDADNSQTIASYCGDEDAGASMTQRYQSKLYVEEPYHDSGYQSRALGNEVSDEQSYDYDERNSASYQQSESYRQGTYRERIVAKGYRNRADNQYRAHDQTLHEPRC
jgi:hypothetical protein